MALSLNRYAYPQRWKCEGTNSKKHLSTTLSCVDWHKSISFPNEGNNFKFVNDQNKQPIDDHINDLHNILLFYGMNLSCRSEFKFSDWATCSRPNRVILSEQFHCPTIPKLHPTLRTICFTQFIELQWCICTSIRISVSKYLSYSIPSCDTLN